MTGNGQLDELRVVAAGAFNAVGTDIALEDSEDPTTGALTLKDEFAFEDGSIFVTATGAIRYSFNPRSCVRSNSFSGTYHITGGTGAYEGLPGGGTYNGKLLFIEREPGKGCSDEGGHGHLVVRYNGEVLRPSQAAN